MAVDRCFAASAQVLERVYCRVRKRGGRRRGDSVSPTQQPRRLDSKIDATVMGSGSHGSGCGSPMEGGPVGEEPRVPQLHGGPFHAYCKYNSPNRGLNL